MVAVPPNAARHVQRHLVIESQKRGDFIRDVFHGVIVSVVQKAADIVLCGVVLIELVAAHRVAFNAYSEHLAFNRDNYFASGVTAGEYFVQTLL